jgi:3-hydroxyanthranilate 3,4-dioxygenase
LALERKKTMNVFKEARNVWGSYDEYPIGPPGTDPMPHMSRNRLAQPFFLVCDADQVLILMAGEGTIEFKEIEPARMRLSVGDTVYVPAGVPSRLLPDGENLVVRLKAEPPAREAVAWYCEGCGELVHARALEGRIVQDEYWAAVQAFNADAALRVCPGCATVHPPAELGDIAWPAVAAAIRAED